MQVQSCKVVYVMFMYMYPASGPVSHLRALTSHQDVHLLLHGHWVLVHEQEEGHGPHVLPNPLELWGDVWVGSVEEEGVHVNDVLVRRHLTQNLVLILELSTSLERRRRRRMEERFVFALVIYAVSQSHVPPPQQ